MYWEQVLNEVLHRDASGWSFIFTNVRTKVTHKQRKCRTKPIKVYGLGDEFVGIHFSRREAECMLHLLRGRTVTGIAEKLNLSPRTIESYIKNMKRKVNCHTKAELIDIVVDSKFLMNVDFA